MSSIFFTDNELLLFVISECIRGCHSNPATSHIGVKSFEFSACIEQLELTTTCQTVLCTREAVNKELAVFGSE